ncbi:unnamed protein product [Lepidochelys kempii]
MACLQDAGSPQILSPQRDVPGHSAWKQLHVILCDNRMLQQLKQKWRAPVLFPTAPPAGRGWDWHILVCIALCVLVPLRLNPMLSPLPAHRRSSIMPCNCRDVALPAPGQAQILLMAHSLRDKRLELPTRERPGDRTSCYQPGTSLPQGHHVPPTSLGMPIIPAETAQVCGSYWDRVRPVHASPGIAGATNRDCYCRVCSDHRGCTQTSLLL